MKKERFDAPIDNKNLMEDPFEDDLFGNFYAAPDHRKNNVRHLIGFLNEAFIDVSWHYGDSEIEIKVIAYNPCMMLDEVVDDVFTYYEEEFSKWENEENEGLVVECIRRGTTLVVDFYFEVEE